MKARAKKQAVAEVETGVGHSVAELLAAQRRASQLSVRQLAALVRKWDGETIAPSYVTDIEKGRRVPSDACARAFARIFEQDAAIWIRACERSRAKRKKF